jgi:HD-like signal output (HDOD) protein
MSRSITAVVIDDETSDLSLPSALNWGGFRVVPSFASDLDEASVIASSHGSDMVIATATPIGRSVMTGFAGRFPIVARILIAPPGTAPGDAQHVVTSRSEFAELVSRLSAQIELNSGASDGGRLQHLIDRARLLPTLPKVYTALQDEINSDDPQIANVAALIENDPALTVRVLQLVNSPMMGLRHDVTDVKQAAALIGLRRLTPLVLASGVFQPATPFDQRLIEQLWSDSLLVGGLARMIAAKEGHDSQLADEAQLAGLLHDIGEVVLFQNWRDDYMKIDVTRRDEDEVELFGTTHAAISGYLCSSWNLAVVVVDAVALHHAPSRRSSREVGVTTAVHAARALVDAGMDSETAAFDMVHLEAVGAVDRIETWAAMAVEARV